VLVLVRVIDHHFYYRSKKFPLNTSKITIAAIRGPALTAPGRMPIMGGRYEKRFTQNARGFH